MAAIRREFQKWEACLSAGNTGTLIIMPMGRGIEKARENSKSMQSCGSRKSSFK